jgi:chromosomal replication initiation ATPase DnaA
MKLNTNNGAHLTEDSKNVVETIFTSLEALLKSSGSEFDRITISFSKDKPAEEELPVAIDHILATLSIVSDIPIDKILEKRKFQTNTEVRYLLFEAVHKCLNTKDGKIGSYFGFDRSTVLSARRKLNDILRGADTDSKSLQNLRKKFIAELENKYGYWYQ